jgi:hypothetical protein
VSVSTKDKDQDEPQTAEEIIAESMPKAPELPFEEVVQQPTIVQHPRGVLTALPGDKIRHNEDGTSEILELAPQVGEPEFAEAQAEAQKEAKGSREGEKPVARATSSRSSSS